MIGFMQHSWQDSWQDTWQDSRHDLWQDSWQISWQDSGQDSGQYCITSSLLHHMLQCLYFLQKFHIPSSKDGQTDRPTDMYNPTDAKYWDYSFSNWCDDCDVSIIISLCMLVWGTWGWWWYTGTTVYHWSVVNTHTQTKWQWKESLTQSKVPFDINKLWLKSMIFMIIHMLIVGWIKLFKVF